MQNTKGNAPMKAAAPDEICFDAYGDLACFSIPALRTEHYSYDVPTPSAICGLVKAIYWHPGFDYEAVRCEVINPIQRLSITQNELSSPCVGSTALRCMRDGVLMPSVERSEVRQQKSTTFLKDVYYRLTVRIIPRENYSGEEKFDLNKYRAILTRRLEKGEQFYTPYFGIRECRAFVRKPRVGEEKESFYRGKTLELGTMLHSIEYVDGPDGTLLNEIPHFYTPVMKDGVIEIPPRKEIY